MASLRTLNAPVNRTSDRAWIPRDATHSTTVASLRTLSAPVNRTSYHAWIPRSNATHNRFILDIIQKSKDRTGEHTPAVTKFDQALTQDQKDLFTQALTQVKQYYAKWADPDSIVSTYDDFLKLLDVIVAITPPFYKANINGVTIGEPVGVPLYLILDLISNTSAAYTLLNQQSFNTALKDLLNSWGEFLQSYDSGPALVDWFTTEGLALLESGLGGAKFDDTFQEDIPAPQRYNSWDSFFTRQFKNPSVQRPIDSPPAGSDFTFIYNACESTAFRTVRNVQAHDTFWLKSQEYSLYDILSDQYNKDYSLADQYTPQLIGSSAYQAFLSPADFHRWHSPVKGQVTAHRVIDGTYYAVLPDSGAPEYDPDLLPGDPHGAMIRSQPWLSAVATRAVIIIEPTDDNSPFEIVLFVAIGMVEVSTCDITYNKDSSDPTKILSDPISVNAGDELGMFHFGGSSHIVFVKTKPNYQLVYQDIVNSPIRPGQHRFVNSVVGQFWPVQN